jgi:hypothetical protein
MTYLSAPYARKISPPPQAIVEHTPGGGMLMIATRERFSLAVPAHVAAADAIHAALAPLQSIQGPADLPPLR